jgi:C_GCAxxG_C_C family probable redox protein
VSRVDEAGQLFLDGKSCSQAVFAPFAPSLGIDTATALKLACGLGGGMRIGSTCGAALGAMLVLGLRYCDDDCSGESRKRTVTASETFYARFLDQVGATSCPDILGCDVHAPEGRALVQEHGLRNSLCLPAVRAAAGIIEDMLEGV